MAPLEPLPALPLTSRGLAAGLAALAVCVAALLALLPGSYDPADWEILTGGVAGGRYPANWVGFAGVVLGHWLLLLFGLGAYPLVVLGAASAARRLIWRRGLRPVRWDYGFGFGALTLGVCMLLGAWPDFAPAWTEALNIRGLPGGVIGQRLCAPGWGLMRAILNGAVSCVVSALFMLTGMAVIWVHDWHDLAWPWLRAALKNTLAPRPGSRVSTPDKGRDGSAGDRAAPAVQPEPAPAPPAADPARPPAGTGHARPAHTPAETQTATAPAVPAPSAPSQARARSQYVLPSLDLLNPDPGEAVFGDPAEVEHKKKVLQETLDSFGIDAQVGQATCGPRVTLYEVIPAPGVKVERISRLSNNICMDLRATSIRILTPIPGRNSVGIEVPNNRVSRVSVRSLMESQAWKSSKARIPLLVGRSISGEVVILDLEKAPHLLIAGATGSGKSVCINLMILSLLYRFTPDELRLIMVDPKVVEFQAYHSLPHLITPVISKIEQVPLALGWVVREMESRYRTLAKVGARNLEGFNSRPRSREPVLGDDGQPIPERLPYIVVVIDELADIILAAKADVEKALTRMAQMSRAVGIHAILATQRPSVNVITGVIKANFPTRIAFKATSQVDSRTILDCKGAEALLGQGDMLFRPPGAASLQRNQGGMVEDEEIERVVRHVSQQGVQQFDSMVLRPVADLASAGEGGGAELEEADEALVQQAIEVILRDRRATTSYLQRAMHIGYNRAANLIDILEQRGIIGPAVGTAPREILVAGAGQPPGPSAPDDDDTGDEAEDMAEDDDSGQDQ